ncbi:MAG: hypothetical protein GYB64_18775 [Chloroflexi bacterium]|nr:hypothetical protein [Chloroflexota bacterium]
MPTTVVPTTAVPTVVVTPPDSEDGNLFVNPGMEGDTRWVGFVEINVVESWWPFYCDDPYVSGGCEAPQPCEDGTASGCNPDGLMMGRPEFKASTEETRYRGGESAQQWFCFYKVCTAGIYQTIATTPGETCTITAWVRTWSTNEIGYIDTPSDTSTADARANSRWVIKVDPTGGTYAFAGDLLESTEFLYEDGHFDAWAQISYSFTAQGQSATVFFENRRLWPIRHNDSFVDDVFASCN